MWDHDDYVFQQALANNEARGETKAMRSMILQFVRTHYPALEPLAQEKLPLVQKSKILNALFTRIMSLPSEESVRRIFEKLKGLEVDERIDPWFERMFNEDPVLRGEIDRRVARGETRAEARAGFNLESAQKMVFSYICRRYPALKQLAQEKISHADDDNPLHWLLVQISSSPDEESAHHILESFEPRPWEEEE